MAGESDAETSRTVVQTYVPAYQRDVWDEHADELDMSRSEYVKTMVQAGRRYFDEQPADLDGSADSDDEDDESKGLDTQIVSYLSGADVATWDDLLAGVTGDIESRLENSLQQLQDDGRVRYSGRDGGYVLMEDTDE